MGGRELPPHQRSFDDLATPLYHVTFVVLDVETTGGSPTTCAITEVGAVKYRAGECLGELQTLVNPGAPIPPLITFLTGITESMVLPAPRIDSVLPSLLEFLGDAVLVGHNVRFDVAFLDAALAAAGYPRLATRTRVDTAALARRLVRDEVPNVRLETLAHHLRTRQRPTHRALDDARATAEVLHALLERAGTMGVTGLDDLVALPTIRGHPQLAKLSLTARLPRRPGVYLFRDRGGRVLYVGKATNLRARVRSYFSGDDRRKVPQLLRETESVDYRVCEHPLEAAVRELRLIRKHAPRFNRQSKAWRSYAFVKLTLGERFPRLAVVREMRADGAVYLGPLRSVAAAHAVREAIESSVPLRRCNRRVGRTAPIGSDAPCLPAQLGVATCPCRGQVGDREYAAVVERATRGMRGEHALLMDPLVRRLWARAGVERFEEAALTRDRLRVLGRALERQRLLEAVRAIGQRVIDGPEGRLEIRKGRLALPDDEQRDEPDPRALCDELLVIGRWLERRKRGTLGNRPPPPSYEPAREAARLRTAR
jgi:DNA polymerase-3 subunit epsilon